MREQANYPLEYEKIDFIIIRESGITRVWGGLRMQTTRGALGAPSLTARHGCTKLDEGFESALHEKTQPRTKHAPQ